MSGTKLEDRRKETIYELAARIMEQRKEIARLNRERDRAVAETKIVTEAVILAQARGGFLTTHLADCHISTCPNLEGCEVRDGGIDLYDDHDCSCGLESIRSALRLHPIRIRPESPTDRHYREIMDRVRDGTISGAEVERALGFRRA
jgi:hypothetical protein